MVKQRPGTKKGLTKLHTGTRKAHRRKAQNRTYVPSKHLRDTWDKRKSPAQNLSAAGLQARVNAMSKLKKKDKQVLVVPLKKDVLQMMEADAARGERAKRVVRPGERRALEAMVKKHGKDYVKMSRDLKMNYLQWTPTQLERKIERMQEILQSQVKEE